MENMTSTDRLKKAIELLEAEQAVKLQQLKGEFFTAYESLKPVNLVKTTLNEITSSPHLIDNIIGTALGLATGYFSKRLVIGASVNRFRKLFGAVMQFGITNVIAKNTEAINSFGRYFFRRILHRKELT
jgi:hypothetical protein